jgi:hypothetical protein
VNQAERAQTATGPREGTTSLDEAATPNASSRWAPPRNGRRRLWLLLRHLAAAVVLGVATLFLLKTEADQHWSDPPVVAVIVAYDQAAHPDEPT